jgi:hypothetical protein
MPSQATAQIQLIETNRVLMTGLTTGLPDGIFAKQKIPISVNF